MKALRFLLWLIVFLCFYIGFLILFQYGPSGFVEGVKKQVIEIQQRPSSAK